MAVGKRKASKSGHDTYNPMVGEEKHLKPIPLELRVPSEDEPLGYLFISLRIYSRTKY